MLKVYNILNLHRIMEYWSIYFIFENIKILFIVNKIFMGDMKGAIKLIVNNSFCWQKGWLIIRIWLWNKNIINYSAENPPASILFLSTRIDSSQVWKKNCYNYNNIFIVHLQNLFLRWNVVDWCAGGKYFDGASITLGRH